MGPSSEDEEDRLEGVVGVGPISENPQARPVHEGTVPVDEGHKRVLVALLGQKPGKETRIGLAFVRPRPASEHLHQCCFRHRLTHTWSIRLVPMISICRQSANRSLKNASLRASVTSTEVAKSIAVACCGPTRRKQSGSRRCALRSSRPPSS